MNIPKDPVLLISYLNTKLRDFYPSLEELCQSLGLKKADIEEKMASIDYVYDSGKNQFLSKAPDSFRVTQVDIPEP